MENAERVKKIKEVIAKMQNDASFKQELLANPVETLKLAGIELSADDERPVAEKFRDLFTHVQAEQEALSDDELEQIAAGSFWDTFKEWFLPQPIPCPSCNSTNKQITKLGEFECLDCGRVWGV